ncbi:hypothetical protein [Aurantiacibacter poecillastricola]|uniref:hypothetical protein n=1 Tax=Aurantiacibacter poecillastricola TaxID=3064385 RepID=UPI00273D1AFC|nr:hypothetical protein [Aurantiacibacter sp. 219JJ12-13]MDP5261045.1 hypothetical protein [Aurantiacibacter sp. 219JJ12-13]
MTDPIAWWERLGRPFPRLPRWPSAALLALLGLLMAWSAFAVAPVDAEETARVESSAKGSPGDLALYTRISERVAAGEDYYAAALAEQRANNYPVSPFFTVRLPTLAWLHKSIGMNGVRLLEALLLLGCVSGLVVRLPQSLGLAERAGAATMMALGGAAVAVPQAGVIHEVLAGLLLTLAFVLYREDRWWPSLLSAGLALAVRELALPFVLLWLAFALVQRRWREVAAVAALLAIFIIGLYLHYLAVEAQRLPGDPVSQGWDAMAGLALPLMAISRLTALLVLPVIVAGPLAILPLVGWMGLGGRMGLFASLWFAGMFTAIALFARPENFYWVQLVLPTYFAGIALAPRALGEISGNLLRGREMHP